MRITNYFIKVLLDEKANIVELESTLRDLDFDTEAYIGKNWFDTFISTSDKEKVLEVFNGLFTNEKKWKSFENDLKFGRKHRLIDFENEMIVLDGKKFIRAYGIEHIDMSR